MARISFAYPDELKDDLTKLAEKEDRKLSSYIRIVLTKHVESLTKKIKKVRRRK